MQQVFIGPENDLESIAEMEVSGFSDDNFEQMDEEDFDSDDDFEQVRNLHDCRS